MRFDGDWLQCDDGVVRPIIRAEIHAGQDRWHSLELIIDTGADRTLLSAAVATELQVATKPCLDRIGGVGGLIESVLVETVIRLTTDKGALIQFRGQFAGCTDPQILDISVLGRDVLDMFALIVDRPGSALAVIGGNHRYSIQTL
jgi:hypothetical protein